MEYMRITWDVSNPGYDSIIYGQADVLLKSVMSLLKYFQLSNLTLPKADGPLSQVIPSSSITAPNKEVKQVLDQSNKPGEKRKRGAYEHFTAAFLLAR